MKITKVLSTIMSAVICTSCFTYTANSKVIEPEIVKTETWTTSYYIDDDVETLYPYIQCEADIYNDGTIKVYAWNTHEWDGFATVKHNIYSPYTEPYPEDSPQYLVKYGGTKEISGRYYEFYTSSNLNNVDVSYYSDKYDCLSNGGLFTVIQGIKAQDYVCINTIPSYTQYVLTINYCITSLAEMNFYNCRNDLNNYYNSLAAIVLTPKEDPTGTYKFRLYGHDITITPELLSGNIVSEPELTEQEKYIKQLEEENKLIKQELEVYKNCDSDNDGMFTANDAQMILNYYGEYLSGNVSGKVEDYQKFIENFKETS